MVQVPFHNTNKNPFDENRAVEEKLKLIYLKKPKTANSLQYYTSNLGFGFVLVAPKQSLLSLELVFGLLLD